PGNDPGTSYMRSMRSTTELHPQAAKPMGVVQRERAYCKKLCSVCVPVSNKKGYLLGGKHSCYRGYSSVVEHLTADQEVPGSNPGAPSESIANWVCHRTHKEYDKCHLLCFSREAIRFGFSIVCHNCLTRTQIHPRAFDQQGWSCLFPSVQVRMAELSKAPDSRWCTFLSRGISGLRMEAWVRIPLLTWPFDFKLQYPTPFRGGKRVTIDSRMESESD